jgi:hypothetical protein
MLTTKPPVFPAQVVSSKSKRRFTFYSHLSERNETRSARDKTGSGKSRQKSEEERPSSCIFQHQRHSEEEVFQRFLLECKAIMKEPKLLTQKAFSQNKNLIATLLCLINSSFLYIHIT